MDKKEFLSGLERSLSVLQEDELRDIISEYEQHIDMKVEKGLTEEEAIADFGSFEELTGELLEAYHVRADYASDRGKAAEKPGGDRGEKRQEFLGKLKKAGKDFSLKEKVKIIGDGFLSKARGLFNQCCRPFSWIKKRWDMQQRGEERIQKRREGRKMAGEAGISVRGIAGTIGRGMESLIGFSINVILWGIRLIWNGCWFLFSMFMIGCGLFGLYGLGVLAILLMQGYPLIGVLVGCVGIVLCTFSAAGLGISFLYRRKRATGALAEPEEMRRMIQRTSETSAQGKRVWRRRVKDEIRREDGEEE